jgi:hypothetical protein
VNAAAWRRVARTALFFGFWGPLVGGLPYVWAVVTIPFAYFFGGVPALVCGALFALWCERRGACSGWAAARRGALCGLAGSAAFALILNDFNNGRLWWTLFLSAHGVPAGAVLAWWRARPGRQAAAGLPPRACHA